MPFELNPLPTTHWFILPYDSGVHVHMCQHLESALVGRGVFC